MRSSWSISVDINKNGLAILYILLHLFFLCSKVFYSLRFSE
jgi:hypothetical protein